MTTVSAQPVSFPTSMVTFLTPKLDLDTHPLLPALLAPYASRCGPELPSGIQIQLVPLWIPDIILTMCQAYLQQAGT